MNVSLDLIGDSRQIDIMFSIPKSFKENSLATFYCAGWKFGTNNDSSWNKDVCQRNSSKEREDTIVCECSNYTHFAIIRHLSSYGFPIVVKVLFLTFSSISFACLLILIATYLMFRELRDMRNCTHVMLAASMLVGQIMYLLGVWTTNETTGCSVISVLLHYIFLVMAMWMLMEGVVLYLVLIKVFIKHPRRYVVLFNILSFGVPALYISVVAPIGLLVNTDELGHHYLFYFEGCVAICWLRSDTNFLWAYTGPLFLLALINSGFLTMVLVVIYRQKKKNADNGSFQSILHWVKVIISLMFVFGMVWTFMILVFHLPQVQVLFYLFMIFFSLHGIIIFFSFIVLSNNVYEAYLSCIKKAYTSVKTYAVYHQRSK